MESLRDVRRAMEREVKKGSCPLMFERIEFGNKPFQSITSEEKLDEVLAWLLRIKSFRQYAEKTIINNVYMDLVNIFPLGSRQFPAWEPPRNGIFYLQSHHYILWLHILN